uniref:Uncharacterized protein n=1 Tax=Anopheles albimanus TaxID=7167 RepID=A0A182F4F1_ANOAL
MSPFLKCALRNERGASLGPRKHYQQVANRKRSTSSFHSEPPSMNALEHTFPSKQERGLETSKNATSKSQYTLRSANPESKSYFEYLLNNYKSHSPLYKEHSAQQQQKLQTVQPQTRSLTKAKQQRGSGGSSSSSSSSSNQKATSSKSSKGKQSDIEYDYSYEDEDDDEVQNDGAYGEVVQTTTSRPRRTTTTVATTTTTTTTDASQESSSGDGDQGSGGGGDSQYALYVQSATRMKNTQHRNGNNKFSSHSKHTSSVNNPVDPAKQVSKSSDNAIRRPPRGGANP